MNKNFDTKLNNLRQRRSDQRRLATAALSLDSLYKGPVQEAYEKRSQNNATKYALGAMQQVDPAYTQNSIEQGERVKNQLKRNLDGEIAVEFEYQGSVPLNVHIRGVSDVDLLVLRKDTYTYDPAGPRGKRGEYVGWHGESMVTLLTQLRNRCGNILRAAFPEARVDTSGSKSIAIDGGSLSRKVDVVPSHWHDTIGYQISGDRKDRAVCILETSTKQTVTNFPFLHMHHIQIKDISTMGGAKKAIRLLKTLKADSEKSESITLNSYDIASLVWHMDQSILSVYQWQELSLLANLQNALSHYIYNKEALMRLRTPDNTRCIINSEDKFNALVILFLEFITLSEAVGREIMGSRITSGSGDLLKAIKESYIA
nr:hypothetical protein [uncultured Undibacterium sp.]